MFEEKIWSMNVASDLIILPEMFTTGFTMDAADLAEPMGIRTFLWMKQMSKQTKAAVTGSYIVKDQGKFYNRLLWVTPDGEHKIYDKRHLFRMANEHLTFTGGVERMIVSWKGWKICPQICYDLRFPVWSRNTMKDGGLAFDVLLYVANWPSPRIAAWDTLLRARAIENSCYAIGVNRIGKDGNGVTYTGHSAVISPRGEPICVDSETEVIRTATLIRRDLDQLRDKFPVHLDADHFTVQD